MSEQENGSAQVQPPVETPAATGPNVAELQAKLAELERQSEGRLRDLQAERTKRQELEQRVNVAPASSTGAQPDVKDDELFNVVAPVIDKHPLVRQLLADREASIQEKAKLFLETKTGKKFDDLQNDVTFQDKLTQSVRKYGMGKDLYDTTVRAYENMKRDEELEQYRAEKAEAARLKAASSQGTLPTGNPPAPVQHGKAYSADEFNGMAPREFDRLSREGSFRKASDGTFVYTPR
jgi:hypothetical protein